MSSCGQGSTAGSIAPSEDEEKLTHRQLHPLGLAEGVTGVFLSVETPAGPWILFVQHGRQNERDHTATRWLGGGRGGE
jgi:hypothetical protein